VNLRKDHCRNLGHQNDTRTGRANARARRGASAPSCPRNNNQTPGASRAKEIQPEDRRPNPGKGDRGRRPFASKERKRLSATDISALASMKNVAKCDTWCELQNPGNHRVFERKLRPKPLGRGHVCLGVTHRRPKPTSPRGRTGRMLVSREPRPAVGPNSQSSAEDTTTMGGFGPRSRSCANSATRTQMRSSRALPTRPQVRRDYPLSLSISISGGKETYQDSPSNGERTGKSPA
jgi:hypothetical protein